MLSDDPSRFQAVTAIRVEGLTKTYPIYDRPEDRLKQSLIPRLQGFFGIAPTQYGRQFHALHAISLDIKKGQTVGIIGLNGSGKSTLLQIIAGTLTPTGGRVEVNGRVAALLELGSGFNPEFTGRENVYLNGVVLGLTKAQLDERFAAIAAFADIGEFIDQPVKTYSSGMTVRLAFAVIAHVDAEVLVIDEALSVGDAYFVQKCMRFLRSFMQQGTLFFCSHDAAAVVSLCDHAVLLNAGSIEMQGSPKAVTEKYLASLYEASTGSTKSTVSARPAAAVPMPLAADFRDMRADKFNQSTLRNDIEIFRFNPEGGSFGTGNAEIISVLIFDTNHSPLAWVVGGEEVRLEVRSRANTLIVKPIIGFSIKNRLGQAIFVDNTYESYRTEKLSIAAGQEMVANFEFRMPVLPNGEYSIAIAVASGTEEPHLQHHWIHDAMILRVHSSSVCYGLVGIPMRSITLDILE